MLDPTRGPSRNPFGAALPAVKTRSIPASASRASIIMSGISRLERLRYSAEQLILDWRDAAPEVRPAHLLQVRDAQLRISRARVPNAQLAGEMSARTWVDNWEPVRG